MEENKVPKRIAWNTGLTKETNEGVRRQADGIKRTYNNGRVTWNKGLNKDTSPILNELSKKISQMQKGKPTNRPSWNKGLTKETDSRVLNASNNIKLGFSNNRVVWNKGLTKEDDERIAKSGIKSGNTNRGRKLSPEARHNISEGHKGLKQPPRSLEWREKLYRSLIASSNIQPNKIEVFLDGLLQENFPNEWKYVGNGQFIVGGICPDYVNINGKKKVIELFGDYWHSYLKTGRTELEEEERRINKFKEFGFDCLIIWQRELKDKEVLISKIKDWCIE